MKKRMIIMLIVVGIIFGGIFIWKLISGMMIAKYMASMKSPPVAVSTMVIKKQPWRSTLTAVGSVRAILGVMVTTEVPGIVQNIVFKPGSTVHKGTVLIQLLADSDLNQLYALQAQTKLAEITYERDKAQIAVKAISKQAYETSIWNYKNSQALTAQQAAIVEKKTIRAPFSGRLGISYVNPGQYINGGDKIVTLQTLDPIYVDFYLPQQAFSKVKVGQNVSVTTDAYQGEVFHGTVTTIDPLIDAATRNVLVEATISNKNLKLIPGMFTTNSVVVGESKDYLTLPQSAVTFNPYGETVFIVKKKDNKDTKESKAKKSDEKPIYSVMQVFIKTGETRGDQIQILSGIEENDVIVTSGQLKLKNDSTVFVNNELQPSNNPLDEVKEHF